MDTNFSAADGGSQSIDVTLLAQPDTGGRRIQVVEYSTDSGATWRWLTLTGWAPSIYNIRTNGDGSPIATGAATVMLRIKTDYDFTTSGASANDPLTVA